jgi:hypothetical protein
MKTRVMKYEVYFKGEKTGIIVQKKSVSYSQIKKKYPKATQFDMMDIEFKQNQAK